MSTTGTVIPTLAESTALKLPAGYCESRWYAACTRANHEERVSEQLGASKSQALLAALYQYAAMEGRQHRAGYAAVSGLCLRAYGSSRPLAGAAGAGRGLPGGLWWKAGGTASGRD